MKKAFRILSGILAACMTMVMAAGAVDTSAEDDEMVADTSIATVVTDDRTNADDETHERETVEVDSFDDIRTFYKSSEYDSNKLYSFIIKKPPMERKVCSECGSAAWTGSQYRVDEISHYTQMCPSAGYYSDDISVYRYYYLERCRNCGNEVVHDEYYYVIECYYMDVDMDPYEAWDGNDWENGGCDIHEDKSTWYVVPNRYH